MDVRVVEIYVTFATKHSYTHCTGQRHNEYNIKSNIRFCCITALFDILLETDKHQNIMIPRCHINHDGLSKGNEQLELYWGENAFGG